MLTVSDGMDIKIGTGHIAIIRPLAQSGFQFLIWPSDGNIALWPSDNKKIQVTKP
jgi:hypothetical protein